MCTYLCANKMCTTLFLLSNYIRYLIEITWAKFFLLFLKMKNTGVHSQDIRCSVVLCIKGFEFYHTWVSLTHTVMCMSSQLAKTTSVVMGGGRPLKVFLSMS